MFVTSRTCVQKVDDKNLSCSRRKSRQLRLRTNAEWKQAEFKTEAPEWELQPRGGKAQSRPPASMEVVLPSSGESSSSLQRQKFKKWTPGIVRNSVSSSMETQNILTCNSRRDRADHKVYCGARPANRGSWKCWNFISLSAMRGKAKWFNGTP